MSNSTDALEENPASLTFAQWKFAKYVAIFYHQARKDGDLEAYFSLVSRLYCDRWPEESNEVSLSQVCILIFARCSRLIQ